MKKVLVVEDDSFIGKILKQKLVSDHFESELMTSAEEAIEFLKTTLPDLILLDILLPGMDGLELLKLIREVPRTAKVPVMIISNLNEKEQIEKAAQLGIVEFVVKSNVTPKEIVNKVEEYFHAHQ